MMSTSCDVFLSRLDAALSRGDSAAAADLFAEDCYWRDLVSFTWNIKTCEGRAAIRQMLDATLSTVKPGTWRITETVSDTEAWFTFETAVFRGIGHMRLRDGKCWTLLTTAAELKGHEEKRGETRPLGVTHGAFRNRETWLDRRRAEDAKLGYAEQPYCLIIGGGQGGMALGARLKRLGVPAIIIEKNARPGDSWRNRYRSLVLHDPVWYDHLPYLPFPEHWPVFTPKDQLGDWLEMYAKVMELNYWSSTLCKRAAYDEARKEWTVEVVRDGKPVTLKPKQLVFATGAYGPPNEIDLKGSETFTGELYHSSRYNSGADYAGKNCIVIGANSSAHDICTDLWENGANATMIQRSPTTVVRSETMMDIAFAGLYSERALMNGITTGKADLIFASMPFALMPLFQIPLNEKIVERDAPLIARLNKAGLMTDYGEDNSGLMMKALRTGSGYYLDVGASELIATGEIKVRSGVEVKEVKPQSVVLTDGSELPADLIVMATGFRSMNGWVAQIVSPEVADKVGPCWGMGSGVRNDPRPWQGELRNMWKPTKQEALWFHGGNLHLSRHYSHFLALQLKARMEGIPTSVYG
ncbi:NAD(P)/FAD-dependent oxidoreductase [soil metagenome]